VNQSYEASWSEEIRHYTQYLQGLDGVPKGLSMRYIGSLISDFHRNLLSGGIYYYPANREKPEGKLRLLYEAVPLAFIAEQAGGYASDGRQNILGIQPTHLHQRTPLFIGNRDLVEVAEAFIRGQGH
jgi:fructose-1,6-bisphosphatase I